MKIPNNIIDGSTLLGLSIAIFTLRGTNPLGNWSYWMMVVFAFGFLIMALIKFLEK